MSADSSKAQPVYTRESMRLAVDSMTSEWDEWSEDNQGTRECFEASLRAALVQLQLERDPVRDALVEALKGMRNKLYSVAERHNDRSCDYDVCKEVRDCDAALKAAGVDTFGGLEESM
jgi:hypothetical protein